MPLLLKSVAGVFAGLVVGTVGLALWLPDEMKTAAARPVLVRPQGVAIAAPADVAPAGLDKLAQAKLALAMGGAATQGSPTRGLELAPLNASLTGPNDEMLRLRAQGLVALAGGDVAEARAYLERASEAGDARALLVLGDTYDPTTLARLGAIGIKGDVARARDYYARAREAGLVTARPRLAAAEISQ
jgi:TPR repeat protein